MPLLTARTLLASAAQVASGSGAAIDLGSDTTIDLDLNISAISGTLTVEVQTSKVSTGGWQPVVMTTGDDASPISFAAASSVGIHSVTFAGLSRYVRVVWTLTGTATFGVTGNSVRVYAKPEDLFALGIHPKQVASLSTKRIDWAIREQTDRADSALGVQMAVPLTTWGSDIRGGVAACSACAVMAINGLRPGQDDLIAKRCKMFDDWLDMVATGKRRPAGAVDLTPDVEDGGAYMVTETKRGW